MSLAELHHEGQICMYFAYHFLPLIEKSHIPGFVLIVALEGSSFCFSSGPLTVAITKITDHRVDSGKHKGE